MKHGDSYFKSEIVGGYKFIGENKHLNYYLNNQSPVFIVIMDTDFKRTYWVEFDIAKTSPIGEDRWWIEVSRENVLTKNFKDRIFQTMGPIVDFEEQIKKNWAIDSILQDTKFKLIAVPKNEIVTGSYEFISSFIDRLSKNKNMLLNSRSTLNIFFPDYDNDVREIFQIPEIIRWLKGSIKTGIPWFYFLDYSIKNAGLNLLLYSYCNNDNINKGKTGYLIEFDGNELKDCLEHNFVNMNIFMEKNKVDIEINKEISAGIFEYFKRYTQKI